jgi:hypothetical protein
MVSVVKEHDTVSHDMSCGITPILQCSPGGVYSYESRKQPCSTFLSHPVVPLVHVMPCAPNVQLPLCYNAVHSDRFQRMLLWWHGFLHCLTAAQSDGCFHVAALDLQLAQWA